MTGTTGLVPPNLGLVVKELVQILQREKWPHFKEDAFRKCWFLAVGALHNKANKAKDPKPMFWIESSNDKVPPTHPAAEAVTEGGLSYRSAVKLPKGHKDLLRLAVQVNGTKKKGKNNSDVRIGAEHGRLQKSSTRTNAVTAAEVHRADYLVGEVKAGMFGSTSDANLRGGKDSGFREDIDLVANGKADFCSLLMDLGTADFLADTSSGGGLLKDFFKTGGKGQVDVAGHKQVVWKGVSLQKWCFRVKPGHSKKADAELLLWVIYRGDDASWRKALSEALAEVEKQSDAPTSSDAPAPTR